MKRKFIAAFSALTMGISLFSAPLTASSLTLIEQPTAPLEPTDIIYESEGWLTLDSKPYKTSYAIGEELDLTGLTVGLEYGYGKDGLDVIYRNVSPYDKPDVFSVDTSEFDNTKAGTYNIYVDCIGEEELNRYRICGNHLPVTVTVSEKSKNLEECTKSFDALCKAKQPVDISGNQALLSFHLVRRQEGCVIDFSKMEWEITGDAEVTCDDGTLYSKYSNDSDPYAAGYCLITANSPGTVYVKGTHVDPGYSNTPFYFNLTVDESGNFSQDVSFDKPVFKTLAGDADGDGEFKVNDLISLQKWLMGKGKLENWKNADLNDDGKINVFDFCLMKRELLKIYPADDKILSTDLTIGMKSQSVKGAEADKEFILGQTEFALNLFKNTVSDEKNTFISPYSVMQALAMTANGADNNTKAEMEKVLGGMSIEKLNEYLYTQRTNQSNDENCKLNIANSIWYRNAPDLFTVLPEFLQKNADYYDASAYCSPFDDTTVKDINNWVSKKTDKMIPELINEIDPKTIMYLINAIAFDAEWECKYSGYDVSDHGRFTAYDGTSQKVRMMSSMESQYLEDENATGFYKNYKGGRYAFAALLPNEGMTVSEYINTLTPESLYNTLSNPQKKTVDAAIPKFSYDYDVEFKDILSKMGMSEAFDRKNADFTKMVISQYNVYINRVLHKTHIDVFEEGTKAAAVTAVEMARESCWLYDEAVHLNRPFVYCIVDTQTSLPVFIGAVTSIEN